MFALADYLKTITIDLPKQVGDFTKKFLSIFKNIGDIKKDSICFTSSKKDFLPKIILKFSRRTDCAAIFRTDTGISLETKIINETKKEWKSPYDYSHITIDEFLSRLSLADIEKIDHIGFNLPWPKNEVHPKIVSLRKILKKKCLYHLFSAKKNWDFIIPGTIKEILGEVKIEYNEIRKPKFEIVSFENSSMPLVQFDVAINKPYEELALIFPEAILCPGQKNLWVYLTNSTGIDICLVLNEKRKPDWSNFFRNKKLK
ncbi:MAG TPA: hypothetical protein VMW29_03860 [Candidatus Bathyarchaeia archaeon]|nr:hypothetical protein [Candidatus Bathyarchaeia archaeon]